MKSQSTCSRIFIDLYFIRGELIIITLITWKLLQAQVNKNVNVLSCLSWFPDCRWPQSVFSEKPTECIITHLLQIKMKGPDSVHSDWLNRCPFLLRIITLLQMWEKMKRQLKLTCLQTMLHKMNYHIDVLNIIMSATMMMQLCQPALMLTSLWFPQHKSNGFWIVVWNEVSTVYGGDVFCSAARWTTYYYFEAEKQTTRNKKLVLGYKSATWLHDFSVTATKLHLISALTSSTKSSPLTLLVIVTKDTLYNEARDGLVRD